MDYIQALNFIHGTRKFGSKLGLDNIKKLLELLNNPHDKLKFIHIAGTNGKGSTTSFISSILTEAGYDVGTFTSPYLEVFNERIKINDKNIEDNRLSEVTIIVKEKVEEMLSEGYNHPTEFEIVTAIALVYFLEEKVDIVVLEVGLGGRFDSTNIINSPLASVITSISMDHMDILGDTLGKIAYEKAGIIKENSLVLSYPQKMEAKEVLMDISKEQKSKISFLDFDSIKIAEFNDSYSKFSFEYEGKIYDDLKINLIGKYQIYNASLAIKTLLTLDSMDKINIREENIRNGLSKASWMGRLEIISDNPRVIIDGAHNVEGANSLIYNIEKIFNYNKLILVIGMLEDKDIENVLSIIAPKVDNIVVTEPRVPRSLSADKLAAKIKNHNENIKTEKNIRRAIELAFNNYEEGDLILISGSLYLIGESRTIVKNII